MIKKHQTPRYLLNRVKQHFYNRNHPDQPWMTRKSITLLRELIKENDIGYEFGSGISTKWFAKRCKKLTSIEHHKEWYDRVKEQIEGLSNVNYIFASVNKEKPGMSEYLSPLNEVPDVSIDFVINDGRIRDWVAVKSARKLKFGGIYVLDNAERYLPNNLKLPESMGVENSTNENWNTFSKHIKNWRQIWTTDGVPSTLIMIKS